MNAPAVRPDLHASAQLDAPSARQIAARLTQVKTSLVDPWGPVDKLFAAFPRAMRQIHLSRWPEGKVFSPPELDTEAAGAAKVLSVSEIQERLAELPAPEQLADAAQCIVRIATAPPNQNQTRLLVGLMVDSYPNGRPHAPDVYTEALILAAEGVPPTVVALACHEIVRTCKFLPAPAEFIEKLEEHRRRTSRPENIRQIGTMREVLLKALPLAETAERERQEERDRRFEADRLRREAKGTSGPTPEI